MTNFLTTDYGKLPATDTNYDVLPIGPYEVVVKNVEERTSISGNAGVSMQLEVRKGLSDEQDLQDTNAKNGGRVFFSNIWASEKNPGYKEETLNTIAIAAGASDQQVFKTFNDYREYLIGKPIRANITHDVSMYRGESRVQEQVAPWDWTPTNYVLETA
ncbi:MAG: DUF669 domain-containing protein [Lactobacillaceae bacterium]|nr:DUF669 domain-containing protein [Lactobacillaceae bacterium]